MFLKVTSYRCCGVISAEKTGKSVFFIVLEFVAWQNKRAMLSSVDVGNICCSVEITMLGRGYVLIFLTSWHVFPMSALSIMFHDVHGVSSVTCGMFDAFVYCLTCCVVILLFDRAIPVHFFVKTRCSVYKSQISNTSMI